MQMMITIEITTSGANDREYHRQTQPHWLVESRQNRFQHQKNENSRLKGRRRMTAWKREFSAFNQTSRTLTG